MLNIAEVQRKLSSRPKSITRKSLSSKVQLSGHSKSINTVAELDSYGSIITASNDETVKVWSLSDASCVRTFSGSNYKVGDLAVIDETTVISVSINTVRVLRITDGCVLASSDSFPHYLRVCAGIDSTTAIVGDIESNLFKIDWSAGYIAILDQMNNAHKDTISRIFVHGDKFATCSWDKKVKLWDVSSMSLIGTFRGHRDWVECVAFDDSFLVTGSTDRSIRVYDVRSAFHLKTITTHKGWVKTLHLIQGANVIVSSGDDKVIALHALPSGDCIALYDIEMGISSGTLLKSGNVAVAGAEPHNVNVFEIEEIQNYLAIRPNDSVQQQHPQSPEEASTYSPSAPPQSSILEDEFVSVLSNTNNLTLSFITNVICAENVRSATDLYCGHNLVLLAIRCGVITAKEIHKLNDFLWFFEENLYYPASKLIHESPEVLYPIFHHAQDVGIIRDGHRFRCEHENRTDTETRFDTLQCTLNTLNSRLSSTEERVNSISNAVQTNARNFHFLFEAIKRKEKYMHYVGLCKIMLSLIPLVGKSMGSLAYTGADMLLSLSAEDIVETGTAVVTKSSVERLANVDLSNAQVTYCMVSERRMNMMNIETQAVISTAVRKSGFKSMVGLRASLERLIQNGAVEEKHVAILDLGSADWIRNNAGETEKTGDNETDEECAVRHQFKSFSIGKGKKKLSIGEAVKALNVVLDILEFGKILSATEFEIQFMQLSNELEVSEDSFINVFRAVVSKFRAQDASYWSKVYAEKFDRINLGRTTTGIGFAVRILQDAYRELKEQGIYGDKSISDVEVTPMMLARFDRDRDGRVDRNEFINAALSILHGFA